MEFVYKPEGADARRWDFQPGKLMSPEVEAIERHTGYGFTEWVQAVQRGSFLAIHGLLFVLLKRTSPALKWDDVQFCMEDIDFELSDDEAAELRHSLETKGSLTVDEERLLEKLIADGVPAELPKAPPTKKSVDATPSS